MAAATGPNLGLAFGWADGENGWGSAMNDNLRKLDALSHLSVISATATTPSSTAAGARFIVPASGATGDFAGRAGQIAVRLGGAWVFHTPTPGMTASVLLDGSQLRWDGGAWVNPLAQPFLDVSNPGGWTLPNGTNWTTLQLFTKNADTSNGWSSSTYKYTVPLSGIYLVEAMLRPTRSGTGAMPANTTLALGFGTASADSIDVVANTAVDLNEFTVLFNKPMRLTAGQVVYLFGRHTAASAVSFTYAQFKMVRISP